MFDRVEFGRRHGRAFLIRSLAEGKLHSATALMLEADWKLATYERPSPGAQAQTAAGADGAADQFYVYPIRKRMPDSGPITVGRAPTNDICIRDVSLSKFHAWFEIMDDDGHVRVIDKGSKNGTRVGQTRLDAGVAFEVALGDIVRFGQVGLRYLPLGRFIDLAKQQAPLPRY
jgi:hypothetical protein